LCIYPSPLLCMHFLPLIFPILHCRRLSPMFLATFSHQEPLHILANLYVLCATGFSPNVIVGLGVERFLALYVGAGVFASFFSTLCRVPTGRWGASLGASGAIAAVIASCCVLYPNNRVSILFLPSISFSSRDALIGMACLETFGVLFLIRFFRIDFGAHLGGLIFGALYTYWLQHKTGKKRPNSTQLSASPW